MGWIGAAILLPVGTVLALGSRTVATGVTSVVVLLAGAGLLWFAVRPRRFVIDVTGLDVRGNGIRAALPWRDIDAIVLLQFEPTVKERSPSATVLLVPAPGVDLGVPLTGQAPDGRTGVQVLDLWLIRDPVQDVADALGRFGSSRFIDARFGRSAEFTPPAFATVPRGYDPDTVDRLVARGRKTLDSGGILSHTIGRTELTSATIPLAEHGYDRHQVDTYLATVTGAPLRWADPSVLDGIDAIDWERMRADGGYRDAGEIPTVLRELEKAPDLDTAGRWAARIGAIATDSAGNNLEAAEHLTPYLLRLCRSPRPAVQQVAMGLVAKVFTGAPPGDADPTRVAVRVDLPFLYALLQAPEPVTRSSALILLSILEAGTDRFVAAVAHLTATEFDPIVRHWLTELASDPTAGLRTDFGF